MLIAESRLGFASIHVRTSTYMNGSTFFIIYKNVLTIQNMNTTDESHLTNKQ